MLRCEVRAHSQRWAHKCLQTEKGHIAKYVRLKEVSSPENDGAKPLASVQVGSFFTRSQLKTLQNKTIQQFKRSSGFFLKACVRHYLNAFPWARYCGIVCSLTYNMSLFPQHLHETRNRNSESRPAATN